MGQATTRHVGTIRVTGMRFWGKHGVLDEEREHEQPIDVDLAVAVDVAAAARSDHLADAVDYRALYAKCEQIITKRSHALLETLASACLDEVLVDTRIKSATIRIRKPRALEGATPEVELTRSRA